MKQTIYAWVLCLACILQVKAQTPPTLLRTADQTKMNQWVDSIFKTLDSKERIGQLFMPVVSLDEGAHNKKIMAQYVEKQKIGGILFHSGSTLTQAKLTNKAQTLARVPLLISLDGEWGLSMRLTGTTRFPKNMMLGAVGDISLMEAYGREVARQCREMGIHINFAPDMDVNSNSRNPVIGLRSFGENAKEVTQRGLAYARGLEGGKVLSVAKHFPGHGDTSEDSHYTIPTVRHDRARLDTVELAPFRAFINAGLGGIMVGHLAVPALDPKTNRQASLSKAIVTDLLQKEMQFDGLCITDALAMKGAAIKGANNPSVAALLAGNDVLLAPSNLARDYAAVEKAVQSGVLSQAEIDKKCRKILQYKYILGLNRYKPVDTQRLDTRLNSEDAAWLAAKLNSEALTLLKNEGETLPLKALDKKKIAVLSIGENKGNPFQKSLLNYDNFDCFSIERKTSAAQIQKTYAQLAKYDVILCSVHTVRIPEAAALRNLAKTKTLVYTFFTTPYFVNKYTSVASAKALVMGYEATPLAQTYAAQLIMGGIEAKGKLPVSISQTFPRGTGLSTQKTRLGYHHPKEVGLSAEKLDEIDSIAMEGVLHEAYPGCQILVAKEGMIVYERSFGHLDYTRKHPVTNETVYDLASITKTTGTLLATMKAYDERKFTLTSRMGDLLPALEGSNKAPLTVKELLYHQSGVAPVENFYLKAIDPKSYKGSLFSSRRTATHSKRFDARTYVQTNFRLRPNLVSKTKKAGYTTQVAKNFYVHSSFKDTILQDIRNSKLRARGRYAYSCVNFMMLKMMLEKQMNQPLDQLLHTAFYDKIGAYTTTFNPLQRMPIECIAPTEEDIFVRKQLLRGYVHDEAAAFHGGVSGNAGLFSSANDLAKVVSIYLNDGVYGGERLLSAKTCKLFTQSKSPTTRRGLGFDKPDIKHISASPCGALTPPSVYGHTGYTGGAFWVDPDNKLIYIFLSNRVHKTRANLKLSKMNIRTSIQDVIYKAIKE